MHDDVLPDEVVINCDCHLRKAIELVKVEGEILCVKEKGNRGSIP